MHQNASGNSWNEEEKKTHLEELQMNHTTQEVKQLYQVVSMMSKNALGVSVVGVPMK